MQLPDLILTDTIEISIGRRLQGHLDGCQRDPINTTSLVGKELYGHEREAP